ncbi:Guanine nucleotide exchange factor lte1 [Rhodotorula kratochvilovae]
MDPPQQPHRKRGALPHAFTRPSASPSSASPSPRDAAGKRDLAVALDGSFVETTSEAAARAMARFYAEQDGADGAEGEGARYGVQSRVDSRGRTVYRIRPISADSPSPSSPSSGSHSHSQGHHPFARPSRAPEPAPSTPAPCPTIALHRSSLLRASRSIPLLRSPTPSSDGAPLLSPSSAAPRSPGLRKAPSSPSLGGGMGALSPPPPSERAASRARSAASSTSGGSGEGDVLGRILGWRADLPPLTGSAQGTARRRGKDGAGAARVGLPEMFRRKGRGSDRAGKGSAVSEAGTDRSDLPEDLEELDASSLAGDDSPSSPSSSLDHPFASPKQRPSYQRRPTGPFGTGVRIQPDARRALVLNTSALPPPTHAMREVSSSDSIRTARADDPPPPLLPPAPIDEAPSTPMPRRFEDPSIFDVFHRPSLPSSPVAAPQTIPFGAHGRPPSSASLASTRSGRSEQSHTSAGAHDITVVPAPGDDPRFVIWGVKDPVPMTAPPGGRRTSAAHGTPGRVSAEQHSPAPSTASPGTTSSRRWSVSGRSSAASAGASSPATSVRDSVGSAPPPPAERLLMAATVERLVAELTSQIAPDLLADFFLTYRHYLAPLSLLHLLIARFEWAMQPALSAEDDALRRVVRVRTFVVVRYWLLNHFMDDFYPSRALRTALTAWLNAAARDERFRASPRDMRLVKGLKKTARRCKESYILGAAPPASAPASGAHTQPGEDDLDLDLGGVGALGAGALPPPAASTGAAPVPAPAPSGFASLRSRGRLAQGAALDSIAASAPTPSLFSSAGAGGAGPSGPGPIARSFSTALGTLGRFKRRLRERAAPLSASAADAAGAAEGERGLELERRAETDLLWVRGGVDEYLRYWGIELPEEGPAEEEEEEERTPELERAGDTPSTTEEAGDDAITPRPDVTLNDAGAATVGGGGEAVLSDEGVGLGILGAPEPEPELVPAVAAVDYAFPPKPAAPAEPIAPAPYTFSLSPGAFGTFPSSTTSSFSDRPHSVRIELDDLDDSDDDIDDDVIEAKRTLKRLPATANLRLAAAGLGGLGAGARRSASAESDASSYGFGRPGAAAFDWADGGGGDAPRESVLFLDDEDGDDAEGVAVIPNFVLDGLVDSDEDDEPGDVEAALRRLEGLVDERRESEKKRKVERQMEKSSRLDEERRGALERLEKEAEALDGEWADARRMSLASTPEEPEEQPVPLSALAAPDAPAREAIVVAPASAVVEPATDKTLPTSPPPLIAQPVAAPPPQTPPHPARQSTLAVSLSPPAFRKPSISRIFGAVPRPLSTRPGIPASLAPPPPSHRSFVLYCRTEVLAAQFTLIERDMLRMLSYQELVSGSWRDRIGADGETDVLDWEAYVKERRRRDLEAKERGEQTRSAVQDVIARFNLTANWVCSEILLTADLNERAMLIAKFIRLAFKCYCQSNLQTLTQIVHGLQIQDVERLHKTWARVPSWEMRKFRGMQVFVSHLKNFKHLRELMNAMIAEYGATDERGSIADAASTSAPPSKGCIPFLGLFLRDLALNTELPTFLDPSSPHEPANVDSTGSLTSLADPSAFASFPPLPPGTPLAPLVNVHKFRVLAAVVQRVVAFQQLAAQYSYEPQPKTYFRCLKIRCLEQGVMHQLSSRLEA